MLENIFTTASQAPRQLPVKTFFTKSIIPEKTFLILPTTFPIPSNAPLNTVFNTSATTPSAALSGVRALLISPVKRLISGGRIRLSKSSKGSRSVNKSSSIGLRIGAISSIRLIITGNTASSRLVNIGIS